MAVHIARVLVAVCKVVATEPVVPFTRAPKEGESLFAALDDPAVGKLNARGPELAFAAGPKGSDGFGSLRSLDVVEHEAGPEGARGLVIGCAASREGGERSFHIAHVIAYRPDRIAESNPQLKARTRFGGALGLKFSELSRRSEHGGAAIHVHRACLSKRHLNGIVALAWTSDVCGVLARRRGKRATTRDQKQHQRACASDGPHARNLPLGQWCCNGRDPWVPSMRSESSVVVVFQAVL